MIEFDDRLVEVLAEQAHEGWMSSKRALGIDSRCSETGEELMVPYAELSEPAKDLDRGAVRSVLAAIAGAGYVVVPGDTFAAESFTT